MDSTDIPMFRMRAEELIRDMQFYAFENGKRYSLDYGYKKAFEDLVKEATDALAEDELPLSPILTNHLPIFLPKEVTRIAFFAYHSKSVRSIDPAQLPDMLERSANKLIRNGELEPQKKRHAIAKDIKTFSHYQSIHPAHHYKKDIFTRTIQFNAYDINDILLVEKGFVRGGLVFDLQNPEAFQETVEITYPRRRKQRSDKIETYLPLKLLQIRALVPSPKQPAHSAQTGHQSRLTSGHL